MRRLWCDWGGEGDEVGEGDGERNREGISSIDKISMDGFGIFRK